MSEVNFDKNLIEINHAALHRHQLVTNWKGDHIYDSSVGWGRMWRWIYNVLNFLYIFRREKQQKHLASSLQKVDAVFKKRIVAVKKLVEEVNLLVKAQSKGNLIDEKRFQALKLQIGEFNERLFEPLMGEGRVLIEKIDQLFHRSLPKRERWDGLFSKEFVLDFEGVRSLLKVESTGGFFPPYEAITRLMKNKKQYQENVSELKSWVSRLNSGDLPPSTLHLFLYYIYRLNPKSSLFDLERKLSDKGYFCKVFERADQKHEKWRDSLKEGGDLSILGKQYRLGKKIASGKVVSFQVAGKESCGQVVLVGYNPSHLGIETYLDSGRENVIPVTKIYGVDLERGAVLREAYGSTLSYKEKGAVSQLKSYYEKFLKECYTPEKFEWRFLRLDQKGELRSLCSNPRGKFSFLALERVLKALSEGEFKSYCELMSDFGLSDHPAMEFFYEIVVRSLSGVKVDIKFECALLNLKDPYLVKEGEEILVELKRIRKQIFHQRKCFNPNAEEMVEVNKLLLNKVKELGVAALLFGQSELFI